MKMKSRLSFLQNLFLYCTSSGARKRAHAKSKLRKDAYRARAAFLRSQGDEDCHLFEASPEILGSSAWLVDHQMLFAFDDCESSFYDETEGDHCASSLPTYDISAEPTFSAFNDSNPLSDWVTGGTDCTGCHGMSGHHDGWSNDSASGNSNASDSFNSHDPFA